MKRKILSACLLLVGILPVRSQNQFHVTQYMLHHPFVNPAAMGNSAHLQGALFYRAQWTGLSGAPQVAGVNVCTPVKKSPNHVGLTVIHDKIGVSRNVDINLAYAYRLKVGLNKYFNFGLSGSVTLLQSDYAQVTTIEANDPVFNASTPTFAMPNFKFGMYYFGEKFYAGFSIPNFLENKVVFENEYKPMTQFNAEDIHYYVQAGYKWPVNEKTNLTFSTLLKHVGGSPLQGDVNVLCELNKKFGFGLSGRTSRELIGLVSFRFTPMLKLGYAYDFNWGRIGSFSKGSHEIMLQFDRVNDLKNIVVEPPRF